jgi:hypothetical protein
LVSAVGYLYRLKPEMADQGYKHEFILAALLSRTMTYYVFKRSPRWTRRGRMRS